MRFIVGLRKTLHKGSISKRKRSVYYRCLCDLAPSVSFRSIYGRPIQQTGLIRVKKKWKKRKRDRQRERKENEWTFRWPKTENERWSIVWIIQVENERKRDIRSTTIPLVSFVHFRRSVTQRRGRMEKNDNGDPQQNIFLEMMKQHITTALVLSYPTTWKRFSQQRFSSSTNRPGQ